MMKVYMSLIVAAIIAIMVYITWIGPRGVYDMQTTFLVVPKDHSIAVRIDHVINDILYIIDSSMPKNVHIEQRKNSGIFILTVSGKTASEVQKTHQAAVQKISHDVRRYYGMPDEIAIYILSHDIQPQKNTVIALAPYVLMTIIAIGSIAGVFAIFSLFDAMRLSNEEMIAGAVDGKKIFEKFHEKRVLPTVEKGVDDDRDALSHNVSVEDEREEIEEEKEAEISVSQSTDQPSFKNNEDKIISIDTPEGLAAIPGNLPVVDVAHLGFVTSSGSEDDVVEGSAAEPTEEELKERLNQLLNGKL